jgi:hypothetical protein
LRYRYLGDRWTAGALRGQFCDPVRDERGKCVVGRGNALVVFADGDIRVVNRRRLRLAGGDAARASA